MFSLPFYVIMVRILSIFLGKNSANLLLYFLVSGSTIHFQAGWKCKVRDNISIIWWVWEIKVPDPNFSLLPLLPRPRRERIKVRVIMYPFFVMLHLVQHLSPFSADVWSLVSGVYYLFFVHSWWFPSLAILRRLLYNGMEFNKENI